VQVWLLDQNITKVFKIFGPGNQYVTVAKQLATVWSCNRYACWTFRIIDCADDNAVPFWHLICCLRLEQDRSSNFGINIKTHRRCWTGNSKSNGSFAEKCRKAIANSKLIFVENDKIALELINEYGRNTLSSVLDLIIL
jgi:histidinol dehydrogenase